MKTQRYVVGKSVQHVDEWARTQGWQRMNLPYAIWAAKGDEFSVKYVTNLIDLRAYQRGKETVVYAAPKWHENPELAGLRGLCAGREYTLIER